MKTKIIVIVGPTASGKSALAVDIARQIGGEIISADSRQVYKGLDIGTGKVTTEETQGIPHHCLDIASPDARFTAMDWKKSAQQAINDITSRGHVPIVCGGTGFYIDTLINDLGFPDVAVDENEQKELEMKSADDLFAELQKLDPERAKTIDLKNKRRLSRAIIIARSLGYVPVIQRPKESIYDPIYIGISVGDVALRERIKSRLISRLENGMIEEVQGLLDRGLSLDRMNELGLEYRYISQYIENRISLEDMTKLLYIRICQYAKRQKTWWKRNPNIKWFDINNLSQSVLFVMNEYKIRS